MACSLVLGSDALSHTDPVNGGVRMVCPDTTNGTAIYAYIGVVPGGIYCIHGVFGLYVYIGFRRV